MHAVVPLKPALQRSHFEAPAKSQFWQTEPVKHATVHPAASSAAAVEDPVEVDPKGHLVATLVAPV